MDASRFDMLTRSRYVAGTRRQGLLTALRGAVIALPLALPGTATAGKRKKCKKACGECRKCKKGKCRPRPDGAVCAIGNCRNGTCSTCFNNVKDGNETAIDCGGSCPRCANGRTCSSRNDCAGALCVGGVCTACVDNTQCASDANGDCICIQPGDVGSFVCVTDSFIGPFQSCLSCPANRFCYVADPGEVYCYARLCGA